MTMEDLFQTIYQGVVAKDWFLVAGAALSLVVLGANWALDKWWPKANDTDLKRVALTAVLSGIGALATVWLANESPDAETLKGALKVWAAAVFAYVTSKKLLGAKAQPAEGN